MLVDRNVIVFRSLGDAYTLFVERGRPVSGHLLALYATDDESQLARTFVDDRELALEVAVQMAAAADDLYALLGSSDPLAGPFPTPRLAPPSKRSRNGMMITTGTMPSRTPTRKPRFRARRAVSRQKRSTATPTIISCGEKARKSKASTSDRYHQYEEAGQPPRATVSAVVFTDYVIWLRLL
jgi:hypothetical protein